MGRDGLLITARGGAIAKALRLYEHAGILTPPRRTPSGDRVDGSEALARLAFVRQAHGCCGKTMTK